MNFEQAFIKLIGHEGGFSDHPADPGGRTMYGITERVARANGYAGDMRLLPLAKAKDIAKREYWDACRADELPAAIRFDLFDAAYNSGPRQAIKFLQRAVFTRADGRLGPRTLVATQVYVPSAICARFNGHRLDFMNNLKNWDAFSEGWAQRIAENLIATKG